MSQDEFINELIHQNMTIFEAVSQKDKFKHKINLND